MIDDEFVRKFNSNSSKYKYTQEQIQFLFNHMPDQRTGALFDFIRWFKREFKR